jgi:penicillin-binding protein 2
MSRARFDRFEASGMAELRNLQADLAQFRKRVLVAAAVVLLAFLLLGLRLMYLQIYRHDDLLEQADNNRTTAVPTPPNRGQILDQERRCLGHQLRRLHTGNHAQQSR